MLKKLEAEALQSDLEAVTSILESITQIEDPIGFMQFSSRKAALEKELAELQKQKDSRASVGLFFNGRPVVGSRGIVASFGAKAVEEFQNVVATRLAAQSRPLGRRGKVPQSDRAQMLITDAVRGSFGFVLEERGATEVSPASADLKSAMAEAVDLLERTTTVNEKLFEETREDMDDRLLQSVQSFFKLLDNEGAILRLVEGDREVSFDEEAVKRARTRTDNTRIDDEERDFAGKLYVMPGSRQFELTQAGGELIKGRIAPDSLKSITEENGDIGVGALGTWCVVKLLVRTIRKNGLIANQNYRMLDVVSVRNPPPRDPGDISPSDA